MFFTLIIQLCQNKNWDLHRLNKIYILSVCAWVRKCTMIHDMSAIHKSKTRDEIRRVISNKTWFFFYVKCPTENVPNFPYNLLHNNSLIDSFPDQLFGADQLDKSLYAEMNLRSQICSCCSSATLLLRCSGTSGQTLGDGVVNAPDRRKCVQERPAVWEREAAPLLKCQRSDLILPAAAAPVSLQDTSASATAVPQPRSPALAARTGELRPRCEASRNTWFLIFFFLLQFLGFCGNIFALTCKVSLHLSSVVSLQMSCMKLGL